MSQMIKETFGDLLHLSESEAMPVFPSPEDLRGKIIISTKPPKEYLETKSSKEEAQNGSAEESVWGDEIPDNKAQVATARQVFSFTWHGLHSAVLALYYLSTCGKYEIYK